MKRNLILSTLMVGCMAVVAEERPNVLIFIGDDCSYSDLSIYGNTNSLTPNLEKLSSQGMMFTNCFQAVAMSSPTRHCLYTGVYPVKSGAYPNHTFVRDDVKSYVQYFKNIGYRTALYGKTHVAPKSVFSYDYLGEYKDGKMDFSKVKDYIEKDSSKPFFMVVASHESHGPYTVGDPSQWDYKKVKLPPHFADTDEIRKEYVKYLAEINVLDSQLGKTMEVLDETGKADNTILIFLSEQGNSFPFAKWTCYNQGLHSGLVVRYPKAIKAGSKSDALVEYVDIVPTMLDAAGENLKKYDELDGKSFYGVLTGKTKEHKKYAFGIQTTRGVTNASPYYGCRSVTTKKYNYIMNLTPEVEFYCSTNRPNSKMWGWVEKSKTDEFAKRQIERYKKRPAEELYDISNDPFTLHNLADDPKYAEVKKELREQLDKWMLEQGDKGQQTELEAFDHQASYRKAKQKKVLEQERKKSK